MKTIVICNFTKGSGVKLTELNRKGYTADHQEPSMDLHAFRNMDVFTREVIIHSSILHLLDWLVSESNNITNNKLDFPFSRYHSI